LSQTVLYDLHFTVFYQVHSLVDVLNVRICKYEQHKI